DFYLARTVPGGLGGGRRAVFTARAARHGAFRIRALACAPGVSDAPAARPSRCSASLGAHPAPVRAAGSACLWLCAQPVLRLCAACLSALTGPPRPGMTKRSPCSLVLHAGGHAMPFALTFVLVVMAAVIPPGWSHAAARAQTTPPARSRPAPASTAA